MNYASHAKEIGLPVPEDPAMFLKPISALAAHGDAIPLPSRFDMATQISWISQIMPLEPGDVMLTGTPRGPSRLNIGDTVSVEIEGIGALTNSVVEGP